MTPYDSNKIVHIKQPIALFGPGRKASVAAASSNGRAERGTVIRFPDCQSTSTPVELLRPRPARLSYINPVTPIARGQSSSGWPVRINRGRQSGPLPVTQTTEIRLAICDRLAIEPGEDEGARVDTE